MDAFTLVAKLTLNDAEFRAKLAQAEGAAEGGTKGLSKWGVTFGNVMSQAITATARAVKNFGVSVVQTGMSFDAAMSQVKALGQLEGAEFEAVRDKAIALGASTKFTASEVADAFSYMALAGWDYEQMLDGIDGVLNLAAASGENLAHTSDIITDAITAFGLEAKDSAHFVDVLAQASANSNTTVAMMGEAFKYLGNTAGTLHYSVEDVAVALGLMANTGIKASQAGTSMRQILNTLIAPTDAAANSMMDLGISLFEAGSGKVKPLLQVMTEMRKVFRESGYDIGGSAEALDEYIKKVAEYEADYEAGIYNDAQFEGLMFNAAQENPNQKLLSALSSIGGLRGIGSLLAIMRASDEDFNNLVNDVYNSTGAAETMAQTMLDNLQGDITILNSALEGLKIIISDDFKTQLRGFVQMLTEEIGNLSQAFQEGGVAGMFINLAEWIVNGITGALTDDSLTTEGANDFGKAIGDFVGRLIGNLVSNAPELMQGLFSAGLSLASGLINGMFAGLFGTGEGTVMGLITGIQDEEADAIADAEATAAQATGIVSYMDSLVEKYGEAASETVEWKNALGELNELLPGITEQINAQNGSLAEQNAQLLAIIENVKAQALEEARQNAISEYRTAYIQAETDAEIARYKSELAAEEAREALNRAVMRYVGLDETRSSYEMLHPDEEYNAKAYASQIFAQLANGQLDIQGLYGFDDTVDALLDAYADQTGKSEALAAEADNLSSSAATLKTQLDIAAAAVERLAAAASAAAGAPLGGYANGIGGGMGNGPEYTFAKGLWDVPEDDFVARLHRGEMVLNADRAREYRDGGSGIDYDALVGAITGAVKAGMQDVEVNSYLNGRDITDTVSREMAKQLKAQRYAT